MTDIPQRRSKISKPLMERRRRARINACIRELRTLLIQAHATPRIQSSKLEKAEILEFTVRHLRTLHCPTTGEWSQFCAGYTACVQEITRFFRTALPQPDPRTCTELNQEQPEASQPPLTLIARVWRPWN
nr:enhancer of split m7 protein-like [Danio rerio]|eukprot:XP_021324225.1 enhancer of split m7 protein-like [Danio rerio]